MKYHNLGNTDIKVSELCLGTMTWGEQNTQSEGFDQMDYALEHGINFFDTAELYPVPPKADTYTKTETIIGNWFSKTGQRDKVILASKIAGGGDWVSHIRGGDGKFNSKNIDAALHDSLKRLQTDYIDLYQLHWPERNTNFFGQLGYTEKQDDFTPVKETLEALSKHVKSGKIRSIGLSNETPWGMSQFIKLAEQYDLPKVVSIQNPYNLLNRTFEVGLSEFSHRDNVGLLAYSPMAFGALSGKYLNNQWPEGARMTLFKRFDRYFNPQAIAATEAYAQLAEKHNLSLAQLALQFVTTRPFTTSNIIGATNLAQLKENIESIQLDLNKDLMKEINSIHAQFPNPSP